MSINKDLPVRIHSNIADSGNYLDARKSNAVMFWYLGKGLDTQGQGCFYITYSEAAEVLNKKESTIKTYLKDGLELGLFRNVVVNGKTVPHDKVGGIKNDVVMQIWYSSLNKWAARQGLEKLGAITEITVGDLSNCKIYATQAELQASQKASAWKVKRDLPKQEKTKVFTPEQILKPFTNTLRESLISKGGRYTFVASSFINYGVSQDYIAKKLGRCEATIKRRLSNAYRQVKGIEKLYRTQIAKDRGIDTWCIKSLLRISENAFSNSYMGQFLYKGKAFEAFTNIYEESLVTLSNKCANKNYKRYLNKHNLSVA